jgi:guanylate kinase
VTPEGDVPAKRLFLILGPSGVGKTTLVRCAREHLPWLGHPVSYTSRAPRPGEHEGEDYHFVSETEFLRLRDGGRLLEWDRPHGTHYYGIPAEPVLSRIRRGDALIREIAVHGLEQVLAGPAAPYVYSIFLHPASTADLEARLTGRDGAVAVERIRQAGREMELAHRCDALLSVPHGDAEGACRSLIGIIRAAAHL